MQLRNPLGDSMSDTAAANIRVLIAYEDQYRVYREAIAGAIRMHRPGVALSVAGLDGLEQEVALFDPHLVICSQPNTVEPDGRPAWFELPPDPDRMAEICLNGERSEAVNPTLTEVLSVVDETIRLVARSELQPGNC